MKCPFCHRATEVRETRERKDGTLRRTRACTSGHKFTTEEQVFASVFGRTPTQGLKVTPVRGLAQAERRHAVAAMLVKGMDVAEIEEATGASRRTIYRMKATR